MLEKGLENTLERTVSENDTAKVLGSGLLDVFSTPMLVAWMEEAAHTMVAPYLAPEETTVGISMEIKHLAPTPVGMKVTVKAALTEVDRRRLVFSLEAFDGAGRIGEAVHERFIVDSERFMAKAAAR